MSGPRRSRADVLARWIAGLLLTLPLVFPLLVGTYDRNDPEFMGFPFYFWYQFLWIPIGALVTLIAYLLVTREKRQRRRKVK